VWNVQVWFFEGESQLIEKEFIQMIQTYTQLFSQTFDGKKAFAFWKGRVALYSILRGLDIKAGDEIILPGYTCVMDVNPIMYLGAKPVYVDIEPITYNLNIDLLEQAITPKTKVILAQHTYGYPVEMDRLIEIAQKHNITVIEDCCLALGGKYKGKLLGTFGKAAYFSSQWNKPYTTGLGGMAVCHDETLASRIEEICQKELLPVPLKKELILACQLAVYRAFIYPRTTAMAQNVFRWLTHKGLVVGSSSNQELEGLKMEPDFFMAMSNTQARAGLRQLKKLQQNIEHRKKMANYYSYLLAEKGYKISIFPEYMSPVLVRYPVRIRDKWRAVEEASKAGVELGTWFEAPLHPKETRHEIYNYQWGQCPESEKAANEVVNLPLHPRASEQTIRRTVDFITHFLQAT
jgi:dTDP-4-amino-4,6-dideoxygalactose transaminase